jgi:hypothetical protein
MRTKVRQRNFCRPREGVFSGVGLANE